jgi:large subunit ribosomal protein L15
MQSYSLKKPASHKRRKRIGAGPSSGHGKTSTKGHKGQRARSGVSLRAGFEGGQMPLHRRIPKRGFTNNFRTEYQIVCLEQIAKLSAQEVTIELLKKSGLISSEVKPVKVLSDGDVTKAYTITADKFSAAAKQKIEKSGGKVILRGEIK